MKKIPQTTHSEGTESQATPAEGTDPPATTAAAHQYLISVGYNGMPNGSGFKDAEMRWTKPGKNSFGNLYYSHTNLHIYIYYH